MAKKTKAAKPLPLVVLLNEAEAFISGFEDDASQRGVKAMLKRMREAIRTYEKPNVVVSVRGGCAEVDESASTGDYTWELRDYDNCSECGGVDCEGGHEAEKVHGKLTGENQSAKA